MLSQLRTFAVGLASRRRRLLILTYHRVLPEYDPLLPSEPTGDDFRNHLEVLAKTCTVLPLIDAIKHVQSGTLPRAAISITFDDGYKNNCSVALPLLQLFGMSATFFVATGYVNHGLMWNDRIIEAVRAFSGERLDLTHLGLAPYDFGSDQQRVSSLANLLTTLRYMPPATRNETVERIVTHVGAVLPERLMLSEEEICALRRAGMHIGAHTVNHPILARLSNDEAKREIWSSKEELARITGENVELFAYPNGKPGVDYTREHRDFVSRAGFTGAVTTVEGYATSETDVLQLPRIALWRTSTWRMQRHLLRSYLGV